MTLEGAVKKAEQHFPIDIVDYVIQVDDFYVFYNIGYMQPVLVSDTEVRGLNPNRKDDLSILNRAADLYDKRL